MDKYHISFAFTIKSTMTFANTVILGHPLRWQSNMSKLNPKAGYTLLSWQKLSDNEYEIWKNGIDTEALH